MRNRNDGFGMVERRGRRPADPELRGMIAEQPCLPAWNGAAYSLAITSGTGQCTKADIPGRGGRRPLTGLAVFRALCSPAPTCAAEIIGLPLQTIAVPGSTAASAPGLEREGLSAPLIAL